MTTDRPVDPIDRETIVSQHAVVDKEAVVDRGNTLDEDTTFDEDPFFDEDAIDDSCWESDGVDEFDDTFARVPCVRPPSTTSLIALAVAKRAKILNNTSPPSAQLPGQNDYDVDESETAVSASQTSSTVSLSPSEASCFHPHPCGLHSHPTNGLHGGCLVPRLAMQHERERDDELRTRSQPVPIRPAPMAPDTPFNSPATNRRCMIIAELPHSLRRHILWERHVVKATVEAVYRRLYPMKFTNGIFRAKV
ncbi:hypothetical protein B0J13DRAFT_520565 [Dactylonectria estremocensis]|uniref:DUF3295 domain-containing protein n=1 Tax=Dactylonectria estremocensis TaxID=1079267 RepID=A0A9P9JH90_9HYPO|nr:hypothetical protein B0J13DRAFT_520565 [Dactylonectria estremocensis]